MFTPLKIGLRGGHSPNCKGAMGVVDEQLTMLALYTKVESLLVSYGHKVFNCCSTEKNKSADLNHGIKIANDNSCDIFISLHMNASEGNKGYGVEAWTYKSGDFLSNKLGERLCENFSSLLKLRNRGIKHNKNFAELCNTKMPAVIFETCFCDNKGDVDLYNSASIETKARYIANAIDPVNIPLTSSSTSVGSGSSSPSDNNNNGETFYRAIAGSYKDRTNCEKRVNELKEKGYDGVFMEVLKK